MADEDFIALSSEPPLDTANIGSHKRKLDEIEEPALSTADATAKDPDSSEVAAADDVAGGENGDNEPSKRPRLDELANVNGHKVEEDNGHTMENVESEAGVDDAVTDADVQAVGNENAEEVTHGEENEAQPVMESEQQVDSQEGTEKAPEDVQQEGTEKVAGDEAHEPGSQVSAQGVVAVVGQDLVSGSKGMTRKIEIPNNKVGVLIGKSGDTIKFLQINSGAKIQITRDADADPRSATRPVELVGSLESLNKAETLIRDVIAEADAGGSPSLVARGFTAAMAAGSTDIELPVPGDKVGLIIGRGGDTIRNLQTRSGARIQLIPQNVPGEQQSKEKKVKITGDKKQVEIARELIKEVMNQIPGRPSQFSGSNYNQQGYRPRGPGGAPQWGNRGPPTQPMPYDYHQRGPYASQNQQYPSVSHGNYPYQGPPRGNFGSGWEQRPPSQGPPYSGNYDYYGQGGGHAANASGPHSGHMPGHGSGPSMAPAQHAQPNYNYGQPRGADYQHPNPYPQSAPPAQNYGPGYGDPKYDGQAPVQQPYGGPQGYAPHQQGYAPQQQYNRPPSYGMPPQGAAPQAYAPPTVSQPADPAYQAPAPAAQPYSQIVQPHQQYPYAAGPTTQPPYSSAPMTTDGYTQPQCQTAAGYAQQAAQPVPGYGQQAAQPVPGYGQQAGGYAQSAAPTPGYGQYPPAAQPGYGDQSSTAAPTSAAAYGYQAQVDPSAYSAQAYGAAPTPAAQQGYGQPAAAQPGYDQSAAQSGGYAPAAAPAPAPAAAYGKTVSPQPGYPQYDASQAQQMYAAAPR